MKTNKIIKIASNQKKNTIVKEIKWERNLKSWKNKTKDLTFRCEHLANKIDYINQSLEKHRSNVML
jgi:hypothetical protein